MSECGFLALEMTGEPIPLAAKALCRAKPRLLVHQREQLCCLHASDDPSQSRGDREINFMKALMRDHPALEKYLETLRALHEKQAAKQARKNQTTEAISSSEEEMDVPDEIEAFFGLCLDEMNDQDLPQDQRQKIKASKQKSRESREKLKEVRAHLAKSMDVAPEAAPQAAAPAPAAEAPAARAAEAPAAPVAEDPPGMAGASMDEEDKKYQSRSDVAWVRPFVPDIPTESSSLLG